MEEKKKDLIDYLEENPDGIGRSEIDHIIKDLVDHDEMEMQFNETYDYLQWTKGLPGRQEQFAKYLQDKYAKYQGKKVLDVGCGKIAKVAVINKDFFKMTAIDPKLETERLDKSVEYRKEHFTQETDISEYDFIYGLEPCDVTEDIIRSCLRDKKDFVVALCKFPHMRSDGIMPNSFEEWYEYLKNIDPRLQFDQINIGGYAPYIIKPLYDDKDKKDEKSNEEGAG